MKRAHIILTNPKELHSGGELNEFLSQVTKRYLEKKGYSTTITKTQEEYSIDKENEIIIESDLIIYMFPMWWMQVPYHLKKYIDHTFVYGRYYGPSAGEAYGTAGKLNGKKYISMVTCNAQEINYLDDGFFEMDIDSVYKGFHLAQKYIGLEKLGSITFYDVIHGDTSGIEELCLAKLEELQL